VIVDPENEIYTESVQLVSQKVEMCIYFCGPQRLENELQRKDILTLLYPKSMTQLKQQLEHFYKYSLFPYQVVCQGHIRRTLKQHGKDVDFSFTMHNIGQNTIEFGTVKFYSSDFCAGEGIPIPVKISPGARWDTVVTLTGRNTRLSTIELPFLLVDGNGKPIFCKENAFVMPLELFTIEFVREEPLLLHCYGALDHFATNMVTSFSSYLVHMPPIFFEQSNEFLISHTMAKEKEQEQKQKEIKREYYLPFKILRASGDVAKQFTIFCFLSTNWTDENLKAKMINMRQDIEKGDSVFVVLLDDGIEMAELEKFGFKLENVYHIPSYLLSSKSINTRVDISLHKLLRRLINISQSIRTVTGIKQDLVASAPAKSNTSPQKSPMVRFSTNNRPYISRTSVSAIARIFEESPKTDQTRNTIT